MIFRFTVRGDRITRDKNDSFIEGNKGSYEAVFDFGNDVDWEETAKMCILECGKDVHKIPIVEGSCILPVLYKGTMKIGVLGVDTLDGADSTTVLSTNMLTFSVEEGAATKEVNASLNTAAEVWEKYFANMEENREAAAESAESAKKSAEAAAESAKNVLKIADMTVSAENLPEGSDATVTKVNDGDTLHLTFGIPKGEKGKDGKAGYTPKKGVDYFTDEEIEKINNTPKQVIKFSNGLKLESREDGVYLIYKQPISETEEITEEKLLFLYEGIVYADESMYAVLAERDVEGNHIMDTYATQDEVDEIKSTQDESLTYFGTEIDRLTEITQELEEHKPIIGDNGDTAVIDQLIENNTIVYYGVISESMVVALNETPKPGFTSALYFVTPSEIPENYSQFPADVYFKGVSTDNGAFIPEANMRYTILFDFDGYMLNAYVSGVSMV